MRKILLILVFIFATATAFCQKISYGAFIGLNETSVPMTYKNEAYANVTLGGFSIGGVVDLKFAKFLSLQPGLYFTRKGGETLHDTIEFSGAKPRTPLTTKMHLNYGEIPLNLLFNGQVAGATFFAGGGPYFAIKFSTKLFYNNGVDGSFVESPDYPPKLNGTDLGYNILGGIRFAKGLTLRVAYEKSMGTVYNGQPGVKNQGFNFSAGYFFK